MPTDKLKYRLSESVIQVDMTDRPVCCVSHVQPDHTLFITLILDLHPLLSLHPLAFYSPSPSLSPPLTLLIHQHPLATKASHCLTAKPWTLFHPQHLTVSTVFTVCPWFHSVCLLPLATWSSFFVLYHMLYCTWLISVWILPHCFSRALLNSGHNTALLVDLGIVGNWRW